VSSAVRVPPPISEAPSRTRTLRPARASVTAAASPLSPEPTTTASHRSVIRRCSVVVHRHLGLSFGGGQLGIGGGGALEKACETSGVSFHSSASTRAI
jgi:hypothetical protein